MTKDESSAPSAKEPNSSPSTDSPTTDKEEETPSPATDAKAPEKSPSKPEPSRKWWCASVPLSEGGPLHALHDGAHPEEPPEGACLTLCEHLKITADFPTRYREPTCEKCRRIIELMRLDGARETRTA